MSKEFKQALFFVLLLIASYLGSLVSDPAKIFLYKYRQSVYSDLHLITI
jgi:hypothetical protein